MFYIVMQLLLLTVNMGNTGNVIHPDYGRLDRLSLLASIASLPAAHFMLTNVSLSGTLPMSQTLYTAM